MRVWKDARIRWRKWSLPTRLGLTLAALGVLGVFVSFAAWYWPDFWKRSVPSGGTPAGSEWRYRDQKNLFTFTSFDVPDAVDTYPTGINDKGELVGISQDDKGRRGFLRQANGTFLFFEYPGTRSTTNVTGINNPGEIVGFYYGTGNGPSGSPAHSFLRHKDGSFLSFDYPGTAYTFAQGINDNGQIVGSYLDGNGIPRGFLRSNDGSFTSVDQPGAASTVATGINNRGEIIGNWLEPKSGDRGFLRRDDGASVSIQPDPTAGANPKGINDNGTIVGTTGLGGFLRRQDGTLAPLEHPACFASSCTIPTGINNHDQIVGQYQASNRVHGFIASASERSP